MSENARPILFSGPMVRAILAGTKTQTREIMNLPTKGIYTHPKMGGWEATTLGGGGCFTFGRGGERIPAPEMAGIWHQTTGACVATRYQVGDRLWVREAWQAWAEFDEMKADGLPTYMRERLNFLADGNVWDARKRSGIHMPRWASRLTLTVTNVRVERLQDISPADAIAEGIHVIERVRGGERLADEYHLYSKARSYETTADPVASYRSLWEVINGSKAWEANPWVCATTFTVERRNIDAPATQAAA